MVRKIFTTRNNKSTREVGEGREGSELCGEQQAKLTQRHCKSFSFLEWNRRVRGAAWFLSDLPHLQQKAFMSFPTNPSARKANIFYTKCNTHFDKLIPRLNLDDKGRNTLRQKKSQLAGLFVVNLILHKLWQSVQPQVARLTGETNYPRLSD